MQNNHLTLIGFAFIYLLFLFISIPISFAQPSVTISNPIQIDQLHLKEYRSGSCQRSIQAQHAETNEQNTLIYLDKPEFKIYSQSTTPKSILTADKSQINLQKNLVEITGNVSLKLQNNTEFKTRELFWDTATKKFYTPAAVTIIKDNHLIQGDNFEADENFDLIQIGRFSAKSN
ncbi:MAG: LPS export ABC transporter periplasmic protein LptC [bacterium]